MSIRNVADYGADHITPGFDNAAIIQSVIDMGYGKVILPEFYEIASPLRQQNGVQLESCGPGGGGLKAIGSVSTGILIGNTITSSNAPAIDASVENMCLDGFGAGILIGGSVNAANLDDLVIKNSAIGIDGLGIYDNAPFQDSIGHTINKIRLLNISHANIRLKACADISIDNVQTATNQQAIGLLIESYVNSVRLEKMNASGCTSGLIIRDTTAGANLNGLPTKPHALFFSKFLGDSCTETCNKILHAYDVRFMDCWAGGSLSGHGWELGDGAGNAKDIELVGCRSFLNAKHGALIAGNNQNSRIRILGGSFEDNGWIQRNAYCGIYAGGNIHRSSVIGVSSTDTRAAANKTQAHGVRYETNALSSYNTGTNNDCVGNINSPGVTFGFTAGGNVFNNNKG